MKTKRNKTKILVLAFAFLTMIALIASVVLSYLGSRAIVKQVASLKEIELMPTPEKGQKIMVFAPHQDDETLGAGGYIATAVKNGAKVQVVLVTDGNKRRISSLRNLEFEKATKELGLKKEDLILLRYQDGTLKKQNFNELKKKFENQINTFDPNVIISPASTDSHPDHATTGRALEALAKNMNTPLYEYIIKLPKIPWERWLFPKKLFIATRWSCF
jgi:LmbE family N-acetylglucosaminyl deacetylase